MLNANQLAAEKPTNEMIAIVTAATAVLTETVQPATPVFVIEWPGNVALVRVGATLDHLVDIVTHPPASVPANLDAGQP